MKLLRRNTRLVWYANYEGRTAIKDGDLYTGENTYQYSEPVQIRVHVGVPQGLVYIDNFGSHVQFDLTIVSDDPNVPINGQSVMWINKEPQKDPNTGKYLRTDYDYVVIQSPRRSFNSCQWGVSEVPIAK